MFFVTVKNWFSVLNTHMHTDSHTLKMAAESSEPYLTHIILSSELTHQGPVVQN